MNQGLVHILLTNSQQMPCAYNHRYFEYLFHIYRFFLVPLYMVITDDLEIDTVCPLNILDPKKERGEVD